MTANAQVAGQTLSPHIDLRDLAEHSTAFKQEAESLIGLINQQPQALGLPMGLYYSNQTMTAVGQNSISTAEVQNQSANGFDLFLVYSIDRKVLLNRASINSYGQVTQVKTFDLLKNPPTAHIDVLNRQMFLSEEKSGFMKIQPVGVGALVNNELGNTMSGYKSLSKPFRRSYLSRSHSELSRVKPEYYMGRPFLRVIDQEQGAHGGFTAFGVHYQISETFMRGFISNGCFRLRDNDLYELSNLVFFSKKKGVPFIVSDSTNMGNLHPFPSINSWFNTPRVKVGEDGKMTFETEEHGLYIFDTVKQRPKDLLPPPRN